MTHRPCVVCGHADPQPRFSRNGFELVECRACGCLYVGQDPAAIDFDALYGRDYYTGGHDTVFEDYVGQQGARRAQARRKLFGMRHFGGVAKQGRLLDVGCAAGFFLAEARAFYDVQGVELSSWSSAWAREQLQLPVFTGTLQQAALPAAHFDLVTLWDVIEHVPDPVPLLAEAARVLKPGGSLLVVDLASHGRAELLERHKHRWPGFDDAALAGWLGEAGCALGQPMTVEGGPLPVRLWPARRRVTSGGAPVPVLAF